MPKLERRERLADTYQFRCTCLRYLDHTSDKKHHRYRERRQRQQRHPIRKKPEEERSVEEGYVRVCYGGEGADG